MFSKVTKLTWLIRSFGFAKVAMIYYCRPKVIHVDEQSLEIRIALNRRTKNHINSMYFGALSVGADITGGFLAMMCIQKSKRKVALIFKDFKADFLKRAEGDVHFRCNQGSNIVNLVEKTIKSGQRESMIVNIDAYVPSISSDLVATFELTLSLKEK